MAQLKLAQLFFEGKVFHRRQQKSREFIHGMARRSGNAAIHVHIIDFLFSFFTPKRAAKRKTEQKWWNSSTTVSLITRSTSRCSGAVPVKLPASSDNLTDTSRDGGGRAGASFMTLQAPDRRSLVNLVDGTCTDWKSIPTNGNFPLRQSGKRREANICRNNFHVNKKFVQL